MKEETLVETKHGDGIVGKCDGGPITQCGKEKGKQNLSIQVVPGGL